MNFHVVTLFPEVIDSYTKASILGRAQEEKIISVQTYQLRDFVQNPSKSQKDLGAGKWGYKKVDERPYGGGPGMVLQAEPFVRAVEAIQKDIQGSARRRLATAKKEVRVLITAPGGKQLTNAYAKKLTKQSDVIILCGRYEGIDARVKKILKAGMLADVKVSVEEVSTGDYVLTGGEVPALAIVDATARQIPGVLGKCESLEESRASSPEVYTRPEVLEHADAQGKIKKYRVPKVLLSGDHAKMDAWRNQKRGKSA